MYINETIQKHSKYLQVHILPKHPHIHTLHITKQVKTTTVEDTHQIK